MRKIIVAAAAAAVLAAAGAAAAQVPAPADIVNAMDKDGDHAISKDEWTAAGRPAERFDMIDQNHDGKVTADELEAAIAAMRQRQGQ